MKKTEKAIIPVKPRELTLKQMVDRETENRAVLTDFINLHMKEGVDYGKITIGGRESKASLFKAGAEKMASLLQFRADVVKDDDTWEMTGRKEGVFCYKCCLYNKKNEIIGMGLGACTLEEKKSYNNAIKIAKKRAFVDAILTNGALSDFFTQDLEDMPAENRAKQSYQVPNSTPTNGVKDSIERLTQPQKEMINGLMRQKNQKTTWLADYILQQFNLKDYHQLTKHQASLVIKMLLTLPDNKPTSAYEQEIPERDINSDIMDGEVVEVDVDEIDAGIEAKKREEPHGK